MPHPKQRTAPPSPKDYRCMVGQIERLASDYHAFKRSFTNLSQQGPTRKCFAPHLEQRASDWKAILGGDPSVARVLVRKLIGPLTLEVPPPAWLKGMGGPPVRSHRR